MDNWRDLAARMIAEERGEVPPIAPAAPIVTAPARPIATGPAHSGLPVHVQQGLAALRTMPPPRGLAAGAPWAEVVADAERLVSGQWVEKALALGWDPIEIFGCGPRARAPYEGLAVWLAGWRLVLIDASTAVAADDRRHRVFNRRPIDAAGVVFLWDLGRAPR